MRRIRLWSSFFLLAPLLAFVWARINPQRAVLAWPTVNEPPDVEPSSVVGAAWSDTRMIAGRIRIAGPDGKPISRAETARQVLASRVEFARVGGRVFAYLAAFTTVLMLVVTVALAGPFALLNPNDVGYDNRVYGGQSNMAGRGMGYDGVNYDPQSARIQQYAAAGSLAGVIAQAYEPLGYPDSVALAPIGMGPALVEARWYLQSIPENRRVLIIPVAYGGTGFSTAWPLTWDPAAAAGSLYGNAIAQANAAMAASGPNARMTGFFWLQGEYDVGMTQSAYAAKLDALIAGWRSSITGASASTPFVLGRMAPGFVAITTGAPGIEAAHIDTPARNAYCAIAASPAGYDNALHYTAPGQRIIGRNLFTAFQAAQKATTPTPTPLPTTATSLSATASSTGLALNWGTQARTASWIVDQSSNGGATFPTSLAATLYGNQLVFTPSAAGSYVYRVRGVNATGAGPAATVAFTVPTTGQVVGLTSPSQSSTSIFLSWTPLVVGSSQPVTYRLRQSSDGGSTWVVLQAAMTATTYSIGALTGSTTYKFDVTATSTGLVGTTSSVLTQTTPAPTTTTVDFTAADSSTAIPGATALTGVWGIKSNAAYIVSLTNAGGPYNVVKAITSGTDGTAQVDLLTQPDFGRLGLAFRIVDANNYFGARFSTNTVTVYRFVAGGTTAIAVLPFTHTNTTQTLAAILSGSTIQMMVGGTLVGSPITDANFASTGFGYGLWATAVNAGDTADNLIFTG